MLHPWCLLRFRTNSRKPLRTYDDLLNPEVTQVLDLTHGRAITLPAVDYTGVAASIVDENSQASASTVPTVARIIVGAKNYRSNALPVTMELEQDSFESLTDILSAIFSTSIARGVGADLVNGNGTTAPQGIITGAVSGATSAAASIAGSDLEALYFSVDRASSFPSPVAAG